jgi:predicted nucleotidyltransferase
MSLEIVPSLREPLAEFVRSVNDHFGDRLIEVRLFGSYARGEARPDSDVDVAVIVEDPLGHADRVWPMGLAGDLLARYEAVITPIVLARSELELMHRREDALARDLAEQGIVL